MIKRRSLLLGLAALVAVPAPAIVRAASLMPVSPVPKKVLRWEKIVDSWRVVVRFSDDRGLEWTCLDKAFAGWHPITDYQKPLSENELGLLGYAAV